MGGEVFRTHADRPGAHPASYAMGTGSFLGVKRAGLGVDVPPHLWSRVKKDVNKKVQLDETICRHLFAAKSLYMFRESQHPSSGALKTVTVTSGIGHNTGTATSFQRGLLRTTLEGSSRTSIMTYTRGSGYSF